MFDRSVRKQNQSGWTFDEFLDVENSRLEYLQNTLNCLQMILSSVIGAFFVSAKMLHCPRSGTVYIDASKNSECSNIQSVCGFRVASTADVSKTWMADVADKDKKGWMDA